MTNKKTSFVRWADVAPLLTSKGNGRYECPFNKPGNSNLSVKANNDMDDSWIPYCHASKCEGSDYRKRLLAELGFDTRDFGNGKSNYSVKVPTKQQRQAKAKANIKELDKTLAKSKAVEKVFNSFGHALDHEMPSKYLAGRGIKLDDSLRKMHMRWGSWSDIQKCGIYLKQDWVGEARYCMVWFFSNLSTTDNDRKDLWSAQFEMFDKEGNRLRMEDGAPARKSYGKVGQKLFLAATPDDDFDTIGLCEGQVDALLLRQDYNIPVGAFAGMRNIKNIRIEEDKGVLVFADPESEAVSSCRQWIKDFGGCAYVIHHSVYDYADFVKKAKGRVHNGATHTKRKG